MYENKSWRDCLAWVDGCGTFCMSIWCWSCSVQLNWIAKRTSHIILFLKQGFGIRLGHGGILACLYRREGLLPTESFWNIFTCDAELSVADTMRCLPRICNTAQMVRHKSFYTTFNQMLPIIAMYVYQTTRRHIAEDLIVVAVLP